MRNKIIPLKQLDLFEEIALIQDLKKGDHFRVAIDSQNVYVVKEHFFDEKPTTKARHIKHYTQLFFIEHGRKVFKILK